MKNKNARSLAYGAMTAALYVVFTLISQLCGLASGPVQVRLSEALCVLPCFFSGTSAGLTVGCFLANLLTGGLPLDALFGSLATLLGAIGTEKLRKNRWICLIPPVIMNTAAVPLILRFVYGLSLPLWQSAISVFAGETLSCFLAGQLLYNRAGWLASRIPGQRATGGNESYM